MELDEGGDDWTVTERLPRRNVLRRSDSRGVDDRSRPTSTNSRTWVAPQPACDPYIVDRYIAGAAYAGIVPLLVVNKEDLPADEHELDFVGALDGPGWRRIGYPRGPATV